MYRSVDAIHFYEILKATSLVFVLFFTFIFSTEIVTKLSPSAKVFETSAYQMQGTTSVLSDTASLTSTCSSCSEVTVEVSSSVNNIHAHTTAGHVMSSISRPESNTGKTYSCNYCLIKYCLYSNRPF